MTYWRKKSPWILHWFLRLTQMTSVIDFRNLLESRYELYLRNKRILLYKDILSVQSVGTLDIVSSGDIYTVYFSDKEVITGSGSTFLSMVNNSSCKRIQQIGKSKWSGTYQINLQGQGNVEMYCDMETDGGWWTIATVLADITTNNLFDTWNSTKISNITQNISSRGNIESVWIDSLNKDIMLVCKVNQQWDYLKYETPFIIYNFLKSDIESLSKLNKAGTTFSTEQLSGKWWSYTYNLSLNYGAWGNTTSTYINEEWWLTVFWILDGSRLSQFDGSTAHNNSPAYTPWPSGNINLDSSNYCLSFIR